MCYHKGVWDQGTKEMKGMKAGSLSLNSSLASRSSQRHTHNSLLMQQHTDYVKIRLHFCDYRYHTEQDVNNHQNMFPIHIN